MVLYPHPIETSYAIFRYLPDGPRYKRKEIPIGWLHTHVNGNKISPHKILNPDRYLSKRRASLSKTVSGFNALPSFNILGWKIHPIQYKEGLFLNLLNNQILRVQAISNPLQNLETTTTERGNTHTLKDTTSAIFNPHMGKCPANRNVLCWWVQILGDGFLWWILLGG